MFDELLSIFTELVEIELSFAVIFPELLEI